MTAVLQWWKWAAYAAAAWSFSYGLLGVFWALGGGGFPFGVGDPEPKFWPGLRPEVGGPIIAAVGVTGGAVALFMAFSRGKSGRALAVGFAAMMVAVLAVLIPDGRVLQNFVYAFLLYYGKIQWPVVNAVLCMAGGLAWAAAAVAYLRRLRQGCGRCGRTGAAGGWTAPEVAARWGRWAAYVAAVAALPYPVYRLILAIGIPLGFTDTAGQEPVSLAAVMVFFAVLGIGGAVLIVGLTRPWSEVFPRWIPWLAGRRVPIWLAVVPAGWVAAILTAAGLDFGYALLTGGAAAPRWQVAVVFVSWTTWGVGLAVATCGYYLRRRGRCRLCGRR